MLYTIIRLFWFAILWVDLLLFTLMMYALSWLPQTILNRFYHRLFRTWCRIFVRAFGVDLKLSQKNVKPFPKHYILIANHPSAFEDIGIPALFNVYSLAKIEVSHWPIAGRISRAAGTFYVDRESKSSRKSVVPEMKEALLSGKNIAIYPEGGCRGRRIFETFHYGAFDLSLQTGLPIVPVFLQYEAQQDFEWAEQPIFIKFYQFLTTKNNRATYHVYDAIKPGKFSSKEEYAEAVYKMYLKWQATHLE